MTYSEDDISDKLKERAGTDFSDFDDERLNRMYTGNLMVGSSRNNGPQRPTNGNAQRGRGGSQKAAKEKGNALLYGDQSEDFFNSLTDWSAAADAAGIKRVDSDNDVMEIRKKVNDEYMKRMIGAGVSGLSKEEDVAEPATVTEDPEIVTSDTFKNAQQVTSDYNAARNSFGSNLTKGESFLDKYKLNLGDKTNSKEEEELTNV